MTMPMYKIRIVANACITRYERGERTMNNIVSSYNLVEEDKLLVVAEIAAKRTDIDFEATI